MPSRREFLQIGFAVSIVPMAAADHTTAVVATADAARDGRPLYCVVADQRFAEGAAYGLDAERRGHRVVRITGDITDFWFTDLSLRWHDEAVAIAGMTAHGPLFCLERFAWDHGLRVVSRSAVRSAEPLVSWIIAPRSGGR